jgi:hypothetical protein
MDRKLRHRPKTFMKSPRFKRTVFKFKLSNNREVGICPVAQTLFSVEPISQVLEVQITSFLFCWKAETIPQNFHEDYLFKF